MYFVIVDSLSSGASSSLGSPMNRPPPIPSSPPLDGQSESTSSSQSAASPSQSQSHQGNDFNVLNGLPFESGILPLLKHTCGEQSVTSRHAGHLSQVQIRMPTIVLKPIGDVTLSPMQRYQSPHKRTCVHQKLKKNKQKNFNVFSKNTEWTTLLLTGTLFGAELQKKKNEVKKLFTIFFVVFYRGVSRLENVRFFFQLLLMLPLDQLLSWNKLLLVVLSILP